MLTNWRIGISTSVQNQPRIKSKERRLIEKAKGLCEILGDFLELYPYPIGTDLFLLIFTYAILDRRKSPAPWDHKDKDAAIHLIVYIKMSSFFIQGREIIPLGIPHFIPLRRCLDLSLSLSLLVPFHGGKEINPLWCHWINSWRNSLPRKKREKIRIVVSLRI